MKFFDENEIENTVNFRELIDCYHQFFRSNAPMCVPERIHIDDNQNTVLIMPAFDSNYYGIKLVGVAPGNRDKKKSIINGNVILHKRDTLEPLALLDGSSVTAVRTGAVGGLAMKLLAEESACCLGIIGTGVQGWSHLLAACAIRDIKKVYVYNRSEEKLLNFINKVKTEFPQLEIVSENPETVIKYSDIIVTTTSSEKPVFTYINEKAKSPKLFIAVGSFKPSMQELPDSLLEAVSPIYVDTLTASKESGDLIKAQLLQGDDYKAVSFEEMIKNEYKHSDLTLFKSVGNAAFDLLAVKYIYEKSMIPAETAAIREVRL
jgi:ornithine cyclodeaminase